MNIGITEQGNMIHNTCLHVHVHTQTVIYFPYIIDDNMIIKAPSAQFGHTKMKKKILIIPF